MILTAENYFSFENQLNFMGASQFKAFQSCEASALAEIRGVYVREETTALLVGSYVDAYFDGSLDLFKAKHPELFLKSGGLKAEFVQAENIINRIETDQMMMRYLSGQSQVIMSGQIEGVAVKIKIDNYHPRKAIVDLKIMKDFSQIWVEGLGKMPFVEAWGYDIQGAIYQEIERQNRGEDAKPLPFLIAGATKEKEPDIALLSIPQDCLDAAMEIVRSNILHYNGVKQGKAEPTRCNHCNYCKSTKVLTEVVDYREVC